MVAYAATPDLQTVGSTAAGATAAANGCRATVAAQTAREGSVPAPALGRVSRGAGGRLEGRVAMCVTP